jgi:hypothetical protein
MQEVKVVRTAKGARFEQAMDIIAFCHEQDADRLLLHAGNLPTGFFDISSGVAGETLQKFANYRIKAAIVMDKDIKTSTLFSQMAGEINRSVGVRFCGNEHEALAWLKRE